MGRGCNGLQVSISFSWVLILLTTLPSTPPVLARDLILLSHIIVLQFTRLNPGTFDRPERWENLRSETNAIPGLWSNTLTFLNGNPTNGNRACIGFKFALTE